MGKQNGKSRQAWLRSLVAYNGNINPSRIFDKNAIVELRDAARNASGTNGEILMNHLMKRMIGSSVVGYQWDVCFDGKKLFTAYIRTMDTHLGSRDIELLDSPIFFIGGHEFAQADRNVISAVEDKMYSIFRGGSGSGGDGMSQPAQVYIEQEHPRFDREELKREVTPYTWDEEIVYVQKRKDEQMEKKRPLPHEIGEPDPEKPKPDKPKPEPDILF